MAPPENPAQARLLDDIEWSPVDYLPGPQRFDLDIAPHLVALDSDGSWLDPAS